MDGNWHKKGGENGLNLAPGSLKIRRSERKKNIYASYFLSLPCQETVGG